MKNLIKIFFFIFIAFFTTSCVKDVDFNQANNLELTPAYVISLVNLKVPQTDLIDQATKDEVLSITDKSAITVFNRSDVQKYLEKLVLNVEIANTFNRNFILTYSFLDANNIATHNPVQLNVSAKDLTFTHKEEILVTSNQNFLQTRFVEATLQLQPSTDGSTIDITKEDTFTLKSAATLFFRVK